jgi:proteasome lid subunit RPN8/RPN11
MAPGQIDRNRWSIRGALLGRAGAEKRVTRILPVSNARDAAARRDRFLITPEEVMRIELHAAGQGLDVLGYYHSHPDCPAQPSAYDQEHAWPTYSYIIVSVNQGRPTEFFSWVLREDRSVFDSEPMQDL